MTEPDVLAEVRAREAAAHDKRNWVRLTYDCNDRCIFCLDSRAHDGEMRDPDAVKRQILDGRRQGATRLILSGGEPTIHPRFVDFVRLGRRAGYPRIQTVTNGRLFAYREFLTRAIDAGLTEITFSIHGPNAKIHDALVGVPGAFEQEVAGLDHALADGRVVVNIDVCVNRGNVRQLPALIETFVAKGVREYDLLHVIPFGRAYTDGREVLFYDLAEMQPYLQQAFAWARKPDMHIWLNRFPPAHCEGFEDLIQDPYKLTDEVRGRQEEYELLLERGQPLHCRSPEQCRHCYLSPLCDTLDEARATVAGRFEVLRVDAGFEATIAAPFGGDPASAKRAAALAALLDGADPADGERADDGKRRLPVLGAGREPRRPPAELARHGGATTLAIVADDVAAAQATAEALPDLPAIALDLARYDGLVLDDGRFTGRPVVQVVARDVAAAEALLATRGAAELVVMLSRATAPWLLALDPVPPRLAVRQPNYELVSEARARDVELREFFAAFTAPVPVENVPACILGRAPRPTPATADAAMLRADGRLEIFRFTRRFIADGFYAKALRCRGCRQDARCRGQHVNHIRAHGFAAMTPIVDDAVALDDQR